jgi:hypothetical protein
MAFVTMKEELPARKLTNWGGIDIFDEHLAVSKPKDPSTIIWENQAVNVRWQFFRKIFMIFSSVVVFTKLTLIIAS